MSDYCEFQDKRVRIYLVGGWELDGKVISVSSSKLVLDIGYSDVHAYVPHVVAIELLTEQPEELERQNGEESDDAFASGKNEALNAPVATVSEARRKREAAIKNPVEQDPEPPTYYGSLIPEDMLIGESEGPPCDFSMSMISLKEENLNIGGDNKYGSSEKDDTSRAEDKS